MNNSNYNPYRNRPVRKRKLRVTGRFYVFLTCMLVLIVGVVVLVRNNRHQDTRNFIPASRTQTQQVSVVSANPVETGVQSQSVEQSPAETPATGDGPTDIGSMLDEEEIPIQDEEKITSFSANTNLPDTWRNILILGTDTRNMKKITRTDTMIIASINTKTGRIKLVSLMRDMVVPITVKGETKYRKLNSASNYGGAKMTVKVINELFGMNITEYVLVNFQGFQKIIDILGGVDIDITKEEMDSLNENVGENAKAYGYDQQWYLQNKDSLLLKTYGPGTHLTGLQALGYARIRHIDSDYKRTERQRNVLNAILQKVKGGAGFSEYFQLATQIWEFLDTNISIQTAVSLARSVIKNGVSNTEEWRMPGKDTFKSETRNGTSGLYDIDIKENAARLYKFIYEN